eukprot:Cvel_27482.t1-p1 / transcript=Cvel_27482.t1 / gene=Cvel_27482 / organism=Chromera_velia_CCMP2878 / gene_product=hypothetical protein / transcript_product=hypothetical protein / location=Cvel_scaffold3436:1-1545(-) / protein_length=199 / sequence_SO=supercontig / SO=protein_coding / is_pseudo=false
MSDRGPSPETPPADGAEGRPSGAPGEEEPERPRSAPPDVNSDNGSPSYADSNVDVNDIRHDEQYEEFYRQNRASSPKLPPPLKNGPLDKERERNSSAVSEGAAASSYRGSQMTASPGILAQDVVRGVLAESPGSSSFNLSPPQYDPMAMHVLPAAGGVAAESGDLNDDFEFQLNVETGDGSVETSFFADKDDPNSGGGG